MPRFALILLACLIPLTAFAVSGEPEPLEAVIKGPDEMVAGHTVLLDATTSKLQQGTVTYTWFQNGATQPISTSSEAFFQPKEPGEYEIKLIVKSAGSGESIETWTTKKIRVYKRKVALLADDYAAQERLEEFRLKAQEAGVFLQIIQPEISTVPLSGQASFTQTVGERFDSIADADSVIIWTNPPIVGMQALLGAVFDDENRRLTVASQSIVLIGQGSLHTVARTIRGPFLYVQPLRLFLTRDEAIPLVLSSENMMQFEESILKQDIEVVVQDRSTLDVSPVNVLSWLVTFMLTRGIPSQTVILLLMLPIIATLLAFFKQFIGVTTFGMYTPAIIAVSFLSLGWITGLIFLLCILLSSYAARTLMRRWRMLYTPKMAIILTIVSLSVLVMIALGASIDVILAPDTIFVLLIMSTLAESLLTTKIEEGWKSALFGIGETVGASLLCAFIVQWPSFQSFVLAYPEVLLLTIIINILLGRYAGLRLTEYFRFRELFKQLQEE